MLAFDADGAGPQPTKLFVGGQGLSVAGMPDQLVMAWNGASWEAVAASPDSNDAVLAMAVYNGELHLGGRFGTIGGVSASNIVKWAGGVLAPLAGGVTGGEVRSLAVHGADLYAGGTFSATAAGALPLIARWNGAAWSGVGAAFTGTSVDALASLNGALYVGGNYSNAGGSGASRLARWNGTAYSAVGTTPNGVVKALAVFHGGAAPTNSRLFVGGDFVSIGGIASPDVAIYAPQANAWTAAGGLTASGECRSLLVRPLTATAWELTAVGFQPGSPAVTSLGRYVGPGWSTLGSSPTSARVLAHLGTTLMMGGVSASGSNVLAWDGGAWRPFGPGVGGPPAFTPALAADAMGIVLAGGRSALTAAPASTVVRRDNTTGLWSDLGEANGPILACAVSPAGDVYIGGRFPSAGGAAAALVARRSAVGVWSGLGSGISGPAGSEVRALAVLPSGDVVAGGQFAAAGSIGAANVARWNGTAWLAMGPGLSGPVNVLRILPSGDLVAGGDFASSGATTVNNIARWDGSGWVAYLGGVNGAVEHLVPYAGGFAITGSFGTAGGISSLGAARWTGSAWASMTGGIPYPVGALGLVDGAPVTVSFSPFSSTPRSSPVHRYDGSVWQTVGSVSGGYITAMMNLPGGAAAVAGDFTTAGGNPSAFFARLAPGNFACRADYTCASGADLLDIFRFLGDWFAGMPRADFIGSGMVDLLDIFAFLNAWFRGC